MDPKRGDYALVNGEDYRRATLDETWVLERFSADRAVAMQVPRPGAVESGSRR